MFVPDNNVVNSANMWPFPIANDAKSIDLYAIRNARGDINEIRMLLKGNIETCHRLFRQAVAEGDTVAQIQLSHALFGMKWGKDQEKDFSRLVASDLEKFSYYPREFVLFKSAYDEAMSPESELTQPKPKPKETFAHAAQQGYLPAILELKHTDWKWNAESYGFAVQLRPFVGQGDQRLDYFFGKALKNGCQIGSQRYYEGLCWMEQSGGVTVKYPKEFQSFDSFKSEYIRYEDTGST